MNRNTSAKTARRKQGQRTTSKAAATRKISSQELYRKLKGMIVSFELYPGTRVTETELAGYFNVSRTPVREALQRLETEGLLTIRAKQGCFIRDLDIHELAEYYEVRIALEMLALEGACTHMSDQALRDLADEWDAKKQKGRTRVLDHMVLREESFHVALAEGSGKQVLVAYLGDINNHLRIIRRLNFAYGKRVDLTYREHYDIVQALLRRDLQAAQRKMKRHIQKSAEFAKTLTLVQLARKRSTSPFRS